jgi:hypothetical protein
MTSSMPEVDVVKIEDKSTLKRSLYHEDYKDINFAPDGSWTKVRTADPFIQLRRVHHYDLSRRDIDYLVKLTECRLNGYDGPSIDYTYQGGRSNIQTIWERLVK